MPAKSVCQLANFMKTRKCLYSFFIQYELRTDRNFVFFPGNA